MHRNCVQFSNNQLPLIKSVIYSLNLHVHIVFRRLLWRQEFLGCCWFHHLSFDIIFFRLSEDTSIHPTYGTQIYELLPVWDVYCCWVYILYFSGCQKHRRMGHGFRFLLPPFFQHFHINHSFLKIVIIIRFSSFDNISRRHTSWIIRVFCVHSFSADTV